MLVAVGGAAGDEIVYSFVKKGKVRHRKLHPSGNRRNQEHAIAFFERAGFAAEETDVLIVEIDVEELANLADGVGGFEAVPSDANDGRIFWQNAPLADELLRHACGDAAGSFRENTLGLGQEFDGRDDFGIRDVFGPAAAFANLFDGEWAVGGIADGERARDRVRLLWLEASEAALDSGRDGRAAGGLRAEKADGLLLDPAERNQFATCFGDFCD